MKKMSESEHKAPSSSEDEANELNEESGWIMPGTVLRPSPDINAHSNDDSQEEKKGEGSQEKEESEEREKGEESEEKKEDGEWTTINDDRGKIFRQKLFNLKYDTSRFLYQLKKLYPWGEEKETEKNNLPQSKRKWKVEAAMGNDDHLAEKKFLEDVNTAVNLLNKLTAEYKNELVLNDGKEIWQVANTVLPGGGDVYIKNNSKTKTLRPMAAIIIKKTDKSAQDGYFYLEEALLKIGVKIFNYGFQRGSYLIACDMSPANFSRIPGFTEARASYSPSLSNDRFFRQGELGKRKGSASSVQIAESRGETPGWEKGS